MLALVILAVAAAALLTLPVLMVRLLLKSVFALVFLPFHLVGLVLRIAFGAVGLVFRVLFTGLGLLAGVLAFVLFLVVLPLLPLAIVGFVVWLIVRETRPRHSLRIA